MSHRDSLVSGKGLPMLKGHAVPVEARKALNVELVQLQQGALAGRVLWQAANARKVGRRLEENANLVQRREVSVKREALHNNAMPPVLTFF